MRPTRELDSAWREYEALVGWTRRQQVRQVAGAVQAIEEVLRETAGRLRQEIRTIPRGIEGDRYKRELLGSVERELERFRARYQGELDKSIVDAARLVAEREPAALDVLLRARHALPADQALTLLTEAGQARARFGSVPARVLERAYLRLYPRHQRLAGILTNLSTEGGARIRRGILEALARGEGPRKAMLPIRDELLRDGVDNARYRAERIARTEINTAYREAHVAGVTREDGSLVPWVTAVGWRLSSAHRRPDICDVWASQDQDGLGAGNYLPQNVPADHPNGFCFTVSVLAAFPGRQFAGSVRPQPDKVPESQRRYYGVEAAA